MESNHQPLVNLKFNPQLGRITDVEKHSPNSPLIHWVIQFLIFHVILNHGRAEWGFEYRHGPAGA